MPVLVHAVQCGRDFFRIGGYRAFQFRKANILTFAAAAGGLGQNIPPSRVAAVSCILSHSRRACDTRRYAGGKKQHAPAVRHHPFGRYAVRCIGLAGAAGHDELPAVFIRQVVYHAFNGLSPVVGLSSRSSSSTFPSEICVFCRTRESQSCRTGGSTACMRSSAFLPHLHVATTQRESNGGPDAAKNESISCPVYLVFLVITLALYGNQSCHRRVLPPCQYRCQPAGGWSVSHVPAIFFHRYASFTSNSGNCNISSLKSFSNDSPFSSSSRRFWRILSNISPAVDVSGHRISPPLGISDRLPC